MNAAKAKVTTPVPALSAIGCKRDAAAALAGTLPLIGEGAMRVVYMGRTQQYVYKLARRGLKVGDPARNADNETEYLALRQHRMSGATWASGVALYYVDPKTGKVVAQTDGTFDLPLTEHERAGLTCVLAMRAYPTAGNAAGAVAKAKMTTIRAQFRLPDMHDDNWRVTRAGRIRVTDLGQVRW